MHNIIDLNKHREKIGGMRPFLRHIETYQSKLNGSDPLEVAAEMVSEIYSSKPEEVAEWMVCKEDLLDQAILLIQKDSQVHGRVCEDDSFGHALVYLIRHCLERNMSEEGTKWLHNQLTGLKITLGDRISKMGSFTGEAS